MAEYYSHFNSQQNSSLDNSPNQPTTGMGGRQKRDGAGSIASLITILLIAPLVAFFLTVFVFQSYQVDGESMETTLQNNDRLLVWKVPKTWSRITGHNYIPKRGDIVVFADEKNTGKQLIKRVIALPGERIVIKDGEVTVYNKEHPTGFSPDKTLPYGSAIPLTQGNREVTVTKGQLYVMGDNRPNSLDSRSFGTIPSDEVVGKLIVRVWPINKAKKF